MVSLKKIGAIATGALFIGATVGMASAITVPSDFKASMLADNGVAKAQLVVGKDAPGKDADTASAEIIKDAVAEKLKVAGAGGDIKIEWQSSDLDSDTTTPDAADHNVDTDGSNSTMLYFDADGDGKPEKDDDYLLYNAIKWDREGKVLDVTPYLNATIPKQFAYVLDAVNGNELKIRDNKYFVTKIDIDNDVIKIGIPTTQTLGETPDLDNNKKWTIEGRDIWVYDVGDGTNNNVTLWISGKGMVVVPDASDYTRDPDDWMKDNFDGTLVVKKVTDSAAELVYVAPDAVVTLEHDEEDVLGYAKVYIPEVDQNDDLTSTTDINVQFRGTTQTLEKDEIQNLEDTLYTIEFDYSAKKLKIRTSQETSVSSGTKLKSKKEPGKNFLDSDKTSFIIVTALAGGDIKIEWQSSDLDSDTTTPDAADHNVDTDGSNSTMLYFDADGDGKPEKDDDYLLYNAIKWDREGKVLDVTPYLNATIPKQFAYVLDDVNGGELKIRDNKYFVTKIDIDNDVIKIGIPTTQTLGESPDLDNNKKWTIEGRDIWVYDVGNGTNNNVTLWISGKGMVVVPDASDYTRDPDDWMKDNFDGTLVVKKVTDSAAELVYVAPDAVVTLEHDEEDVLGYAKVYIPEVDQNDDLTSTTDINVQFRGTTQTLEKDEIQDLEDTLYTIEFDYSAKKLKIRTTAETTVSSGTKLKSKKEPGKNFLDSDKTSFITITSGAGEEEVVPELEIVDEDTADTSMNLVLIGGPVANKLTADLVSAGKSKVDWYTSDGDIEVIADAFGTGTYGIIVAGKTRTETAAAAQALADAL